jgi:hypothetical protein
VDFERTIKMVNPEAKIYTLEEDASQVASGIHPMPLTLRANVGDCIKVKLTNRMKEGRASFSAISPAFDPKDSLGADVGNNPGDHTVGPGENRTYTYYADPFHWRDGLTRLGLGQLSDARSGSQQAGVQEDARGGVLPVSVN